MSIWDAFSGVPNPRQNKPKPCACCGKFHGLNSEVKKNDAKKDTNPSHSTSEKENYSDTDDAVIVQLKNGGSTWKEILKAIGKHSESQLKDHFKDNLKDKSSTTTSQLEPDNKKVDDTAKGKKGGKGGKVADTADSKKGGSKQGDKQQEDNLKAWADSYDQKKWLAVASKHFDKTGQRITAEMAQKLAENK